MKAAGIGRVHSKIFAGAIFMAIALFSVSTVRGQGKEKLTPEALLQRHLASIGTVEARQRLKSMTVVGTSVAVFKGRGEGRAEGIAVLASQGDMNMIGMKFNNPDYPHEKMGYDGSSFTVGFVRPGTYSVLGQFLRINERTFRSGLLGGVLSTSWELGRSEENRGKLKPKGTAKVEDAEVLKFTFDPKKGSDLDINMYFDPTTFRHLRTEYRRVIAAKQGLTVDTSSQQSETRYRMTEDFADFREEDGFTLPHKYVLSLEILSGTGTTSYTWTIDLQQYRFDQPLEASEFRMDTE